MLSSSSAAPYMPDMPMHPRAIGKTSNVPRRRVVVMRRTIAVRMPGTSRAFRRIGGTHGKQENSSDGCEAEEGSARDRRRGEKEIVFEKEVGESHPGRRAQASRESDAEAASGQAGHRGRAGAASAVPQSRLSRQRK